MPTRILFVCLGNICRSPAAEGVFATLVEREGRSAEFELDSAGTGAWHVGEPPDARMRRAAEARGITLTGRARQVTAADFDRFDLIFAMDRQNRTELLERAPPDQRHKVQLFRDHDADAPGEDVPDPYYGGADGFDDVLDIVTRTGASILASIRHPVPPSGHD